MDSCSILDVALQYNICGKPVSACSDTQEVWKSEMLLKYNKIQVRCRVQLTADLMITSESFVSCTSLQGLLAHNLSVSQRHACHVARCRGRPPIRYCRIREMEGKATLFAPGSHRPSAYPDCTPHHLTQHSLFCFSRFPFLLHTQPKSPVVIWKVKQVNLDFLASLICSSWICWFSLFIIIISMGLYSLQYGQD